MSSKEIPWTGVGVPSGLTVEYKFINVTLKKAAEWVELGLNQAPVSNPSTSAGAAVLE
jgi:hypothetical protein